ncbi:phage holin family protein [Parabacteroides sp. PF5-6]|uniref:phage holin family protein n=1 Tax=Parabacteroides sp. PF5-6 TaxID=1742403 RepID=UPI00240718E4|nr:phage holin family protein [Parabacteroides sp. PF5-6]MDF9828858.1 mannose/fructose/N-acetylgalactosamine-specific phosphotransferase system component IIC [Parabacteroides sp. PF5-6]
MEKDLGQVFNALKEDISTYVEIRFKFYKLSFYEKAGKLVSSLSYILALVVLIFMATFFLFLALGFLLGEWLDSTGAGIAIVAGIYLILIGILIMNKKGFSDKIMNNVIAALDDDDDDDDEDPNQNETKI